MQANTANGEALRQGGDMKRGATRKGCRRAAAVRTCRTAYFCSALALIAVGAVPKAVVADEGGVSF